MMGNSGLSMLLKSFGFDPNEITEQVEAARAGVLQMVKHFDGRLRAMEAKQDRILALLENKAGGGSSCELVPHSGPEAATEAAWKQSA